MNEREAEHRIRRMIAQARWEQHVYRSEMILQRISGIVWTIIFAGCWWMLGEIEYGLFFGPWIVLSLMMTFTDRNIEREGNI